MKRIFGNWWVLTGLVVVLLLLVFCLGLPLVVTALEPWWVRLLFAVLILGTWGLFGFLRARKARKAVDAIAAELATPSASDQEGAAVASRMAEALNSLKSATGAKRDYLYSRPWYVIIGPPGAGKTTALLNSGLRFPFADQSFKGVGGTRNLDFLFADEAALVDTAGRYTTQDSDQSVDTRGWQSFLEMLKRHRPLSPINGVIVALGVDELLTADRAGIDRHAAAVRRRLTELRATLEVSVPVYVLFTKADLLAGFVEYYDDLDVEGRRAALGATLPVANARPKIEDVLAQFDEMVVAQGARQAKRLYEEVDQRRRSMILGFPAQLAALRNRFARFIEGAFIAGEQPSATLRGFYFTSGVQEGAPLDRILAGVAQVYQDSSAGRGSSGRTYFLNRVLTEVIFGEAGLVQADPAARKRQQARMTLGLAGVAAVCALVLLAWGVSFIKNKSFQSELNASSVQAAAQIKQTGDDLVEVRSTDPDLEQSLGVLNTLRDLPQGYADQLAGAPGLLMRFGLFQSSHAAMASEAYRSALRRIMLPRLLLRLEQYMAGHGGDPLSLYQALKVYLMLGGQGPLDAGTVKSWVTSDWAAEQFPGADRAPERKQLTDHLSALLEDESMNVSWAGQKAPLDGTVIASARAALSTLSLADRAYAVLRQKAMGSGGAPWMASAALSAGDAQAFANGAEVLQLQVPFFYTSAGYEQAYQIGLATVADDMKNEMWVLGDAAGTTGLQAQMSQIRPGVASLYAKDYIAAWEKVATTPKPANYFGDAAAMGSFTKTPSPLKVLLLELRKNTTFTGGTGAAKSMLADKLSSGRLGTAAKLVPGAGAGGFDAGAQIASYFKPLQDYVGDGKAPAPIDDFLAAIKQAGTAVASAKFAGGGMGSEGAQGAMATAMGSMSAVVGGAPPQMQGFVSAAAGGGKTASVTAAQGAIADAYTKSVLPDCKTATEDKYPFVGTSQVDASLVDVQRVFGPSGTFDAFLQQRVTPLLDKSGPIWRWSATDPTAATLQPSSPDEFRKAAQLRDTLVGGITTKWASKSFGGGVDAVELTVGSTTYRFDATTSGDRPVIWSPQGNVPRASVTLFTGTTKVGEIVKEGPWALFRLMDEARKENSGPLTLLATFGSNAKTAVFQVSLTDENNPFGRGGVWSFRCPVAL